jgi:hypothetical protein
MLQKRTRLISSPVGLIWLYYSPVEPAFIDCILSPFKINFLVLYFYMLSVYCFNSGDHRI